MASTVSRRGFGRNDRHIASGVGKAAQDVVLAAEIHRNDPVSGVAAMVAGGCEIPASFLPFRLLRRG